MSDLFKVIEWEIITDSRGPAIQASDVFWMWYLILCDSGS